MVRAMSDYQMIEEGDRVLAAVSGGKDSTAMLIHMKEIERRANVSFTVDALLIDQKQPWFDPDPYISWMTARGFTVKIIEDPIFDVALKKTRPGKSLCRLCSRLRRGALYTYAEKNGYSKIALGHHRDDINETLLLNLFFAGRLAAMPPKLFSDNGKHVVIRPMCYVEENGIISFKNALGIPVVTCDSCSAREKGKREEMKILLKNLENQYPGLQATLFKSLQQVRTSQLMDRELFDFHSILPRY
jgi:tRNA 2-thiocytidine biosynthesis protein TtcA